MPRTARSPRPPLDADALERLALHYAARYATTRAKLAGYLKRKVVERGWQGALLDIEAVVDRMVTAGYVDDRAFAENRTAAMGRRGYGGRRIGAALAAAGIERGLATELRPDAAAAFDAADRYARRKRIGPYSTGASDSDARRKALQAMARAGHEFSLARRFANAEAGMIPNRDDSET